MYRFIMLFLYASSVFSFHRTLQPSRIRFLAKKSTDDISFLPREFSSKKKGSRRSIYPDYKARTNNQKDYVSALANPNYPIVFGTGPAGCGKTLFACLSAMNKLQHKEIDKIILTRPVVPVEEEELGFLPGNLIRKMDPWTRPIFDIFLEFYQQRDIEAMLHSGTIEVSPLAYMRGRTFKRSFLIADEMQNSTPNQMLMLTTRIGDYSKMVITGDPNQTYKLQNNGLTDFTKKFQDYQTFCDSESQNTGIQIVQMDQSDIQRSPIVNEVLKIYNIPSSATTDLSSFSVDNLSSNNDAAIIPKDKEPKRKLI